MIGLIDRVLAELKENAIRVEKEEDLKVNAERILYNEVLSKLGNIMENYI